MHRLDALLTGVAAGYGVAVPVGAIGVLIVDAGLRRGFVPAFAAGAGTATADLVYATVAALGGAATAAALEPYRNAVRLTSAAVLGALAAYALVRALHARRDGSEPPSVATTDPATTYVRFLALTLVNPMTVAYFVPIVAGLGGAALAGATAKVLFVLGAFAASLSWQTLLAAAGAGLRHRLPASAQTWTAVVGAAIVAALALRLALQ